MFPPHIFLLPFFLSASGPAAAKRPPALGKRACETRYHLFFPFASPQPAHPVRCIKGSYTVVAVSGAPVAAYCRENPGLGRCSRAVFLCASPLPCSHRQLSSGGKRTVLVPGHHIGHTLAHKNMDRQGGKCFLAVFVARLHIFLDGDKVIHEQRKHSDARNQVLRQLSYKKEDPVCVKPCPCSWC